MVGMLNICNVDFFEHDGGWSTSPADASRTAEIVRRLNRAGIAHEVRKARWGHTYDRQVFLPASVNAQEIAETQAAAKRAQWEHDTAQFYENLRVAKAAQELGVPINWDEWGW